MRRNHNLGGEWGAVSLDRLAHEPQAGANRRPAEGDDEF